MPKKGLYLPWCKVEVGRGEEKETFIYGDGKLRAVSVTLSEGKNLSNCSISIYDEDRSVTNRFFAYVKEIGGLEPLEVEESKPETQSSGGGTAAIGDLAEPEVVAVLDMIAWAEGTSTIAASDNGYNVNVGGSLFNGYSWHPNIGRVVAANSTAAGRYQFLDKTWESVAKTLSLKTFEPKNQDLAAVQLLKNRGAYNNVLNREWAAMLDKISYEWASLPASNGSYRYSGQGTKTPTQVYDYLNNKLQSQPTEEEKSQESAVESQETVTATNEKSPGREATLAGQQITIYLGFDGNALAAYSFIHTGLDYNYSESTLVFTGSAAAWVLSQEKKNSAYINLSLKQLATKIADSYGLTVEMDIEGPYYVYIPQKALSDYELLLRECQRVGLIIKNIGNNKIEIKAREDIIKENQNNIYTIQLYENVSSFRVTHQAQGNSSGGARSPEEPNRTGVKKYGINPDTGEFESKEKEVKQTPDSSSESTTGDNVDENKPLTNGMSDLEDSARKANEMRIKGIVAQFSTPAAPETLILTPDDIIQSKGFSSQEIDVLDRVWVCESITHALGDTYTTSGVIYTPLKNRYPSTTTTTTTATTGSSSAESNPGGFIRPAAGKVTSGFGPRNGRNHNGVDISKSGDVPIWASSDGTVSAVNTGCPLNGYVGSSCGGGYGNFVYITHSGGFITRYAHLKQVSVTNGEEVKQGQQIGLMGNSGSSTGTHLHFEIRLNGNAVNPAQYINL